MATSSLTSTVPQFYSPTSGAHRRSQRRRSVVSLPASAAFTGAVTSLRLRRSQLSSPVLQPRLLSNAGLRNRLVSVPVSRLHNSLKDHTFATSTEASCLSCFKSHARGAGAGGLSNLRRLRPGAFSDKSTFPLRSHFFGASLSGKPSHLTCASVGPDEPHAASPTLSDTLLEKPGLNFLDPESEKAELESLLNYPLPNHPKVHRGELKNGLRYIILPNRNPANRFEAHMEVHVGSVDEEEDEQGIAHMIEHVTFLGSKKREKLLGTGARSNAYTDFHHTVFHIHSPTYSKDSGEYLLPSVLDALNEIAFYPKFLPSRVEKERKAILSELQMMNTIEYRIDCQLLQHLHADNKLSQRFPIGLEEQIKKWDPEKIQRFHERWYYPANATLYLVGDIPSVSDAVRHIEAVFDTDPSPPPSPRSPLQSPMAKLFVNNFVRGAMAPSLSSERETAAKSKQVDGKNAVKRERQVVRPPVEHEWSLPGSAHMPKPPQIFQHELIPNFSLNMFAKVPVTKGLTYRDLRDMLMKRIFVSALHFRINTRYKSSNPRFTSIDLDHSDSGREGCAVTTLTITSEPKNWCDAIKVAVHEVRRLKEFGVTKGEMTRYMDALIKDSEQLASMIENIPSLDNLDFIMESDALGHTVMDQSQGYECLVAVAETVTLEEVNAVGKQMLEFISDYGQPLAPPPTAIVACVPKKVHVDGAGEADFVITSEEITDAIKEALQEPIYPEPELEVPTELISTAQLEELKLERKPSFVALNGEDRSTKLFDEETGIVQRRLANGISVNYKITPFEKNIGVMRLIVCGGRATETADSKGAVIVGVRALSEGGCVGNFSREQVELFCVNNLINCSLECTEECIYMEFRFSLRDKGMRAAFQLLHMVLEHNMWLEDAFDRARQLYLSYYRSIPKSLERSTAHRLMRAMLNGDERFVEPTPESLQKLTVESVKDAVMSHFFGDNMELSIAGDFTEEEIESCILDYLGTVHTTSKPDLKNLETIDPFVFRPFPSDLHFQQIRINDTDERACAYIAGPAPNRWGFTHDGKDLFQVIKSSSSNGEQPQLPGVNIRNHPLFFGVTLGLLAEIINSRLFTTVRDSLGLTYDVSFEVNLFDKLGLGWYVISVTSTPEKVQKAVDACKGVLRGLDHNKISQRELDRAKRTLLMKHIQDCESNNIYWLALMAHLQAKSVPRKDVSCIRDLSTLYEGATIDDIYLAYKYLGVDNSSLFACIGISGADTQPDDDVADTEDELDTGLHGTIPTGRGRSTMTRPTS